MVDQSFKTSLSRISSQSSCKKYVSIFEIKISTTQDDATKYEFEQIEIGSSMYDGLIFNQLKGQNNLSTYRCILTIYIFIYCLINERRVDLAVFLADDVCFVH
ncbi:hypothetical protein R6Q57_025513 [Mikania cordata]